MYSKKQYQGFLTPTSLEVGDAYASGGRTAPGSFSYAGQNKPEAVAEWVDKELQEVERSMRMFDYLQLAVLGSSPSKPRDGMVVYADSVGWNPGSGAGFYGYRASAWRKLDT